VAHGKPPQFAILNHATVDSGIPRESATQRIGIIRPSGLLLMFEPNSRYLLESLRKLWYRWDSSFEHSTESALDHDDLSALAAPYFQPLASWHMGGRLLLDLQQHGLPRLEKNETVSRAGSISARARLQSAARKISISLFLARWRRLDTPLADNPATLK
jgi:hypothetical protein